MKKKLLALTLTALFFMTFVSCDLLSTINAVRGFYTEYNEFSALYNEATQYSVLTETDLTISNTTIESMLPSSSRVYFMLDENSTFLYVEQNLQGVDRVTLYEDAEDIYVAYEINGNIVTPKLPEPEERFDGNTNANILNDSFSYEDVQNENKTGDRTYELDVFLTQAINLDVLADFLDQIKVFDESLTSLNDVVAHLIITFDSVDSTIDVTATVTEHTITFEDLSTVTFSLTNHTVLKIPEVFEMPNVFALPYEMVAVDNILLARRAYIGEEVIVYPAVADEPGWVQVYLVAGTHELYSASPTSFVASLFDAEQNPVDWNATQDGSYVVDIVADGTYYLYVTPLEDFEVDFMFDLDESTAVVTTTEATTTEAVTTEATTTEEVTTEATTTEEVTIDTTSSATTED